MVSLKPCVFRADISMTAIDEPVGFQYYRYDTDRAARVRVVRDTRGR